MHDIYVISAPITGRVLRVEVEPGDEVAAGAVVARMSRAAAGFLDTRSDLQARAAVTASGGAAAFCAGGAGACRARASSRNTELVAANLISKAAADQSEARLDAARAARDAARAEVDACTQRVAGSFPYCGRRWSTSRAPVRAACCACRRKAKPSSPRARPSSKSATRGMSKSSRSSCRRMPCG